MDIITDLQNNDTTRVSPKSFQVMTLLGKGKYGTVFKVRKVEGNDEDKIFAMKIVQKKILVEELNEYSNIRNALSEKNVLRTCDHPFIIKLTYSFQTDTNLHYVMEYASGGNFHDYLLEQGKLPETSVSFYIKQLILAVEYLHSRAIIHRDIKAANILLDCNGFIKLADFGLCRKQFANKRIYSMCGTMCYMAPEIFEGSGYGKEVDWWSTGVFFYQMIVGNFPFSGNTNSMIEKIKRCEYNNPPGFVSPAAKSLIKMLLELNVTDRLGSNGAYEVKKHEFFLNASWENIFYQLEAPPFIPKNMRATGVSMDDLMTNDEKIDKIHNSLFKGFSFTYDSMEDVSLRRNSEHKVKIYGVDRLLSKTNERSNFPKYNLLSGAHFYWNRLRKITSS